MPIQVKLGGELKRYGAGTQSIETSTPITVAQAMERLGINEEPEDVLVIVNEQVVPPSEREKTTVTGDDRIALMPQLKGG